MSKLRKDWEVIMLDRYSKYDMDVADQIEEDAKIIRDYINKKKIDYFKVVHIGTFIYLLVK